MRYNDEKYTAAVNTLAEQLVAMILDDEYDKEDWDIAATDYAVTTAQDIDNAIEKLLEKLREEA